MDWQNIEQLLDKYYEGETSLEEEAYLKKVLSRDDCPEQFRVEQQLFGCFEKEATENMPSKVDAIQLGKQSSSKWMRLLYQASPVAAAALLFAIISIQQPQRQACTPNEEVLAVINNQKICNSEIAEQEAREALQFVIYQLNQSTSKVNSNQQKIKNQ